MMYTDEFRCSDGEEARKMLELYGVAVISSAIDADECRRMNDGMWDAVELLTSTCDVPVTRDDPSSWHGFYALNPHHGMLVQYYGLSHAQYAWDVRQNVNVHKLFASVLRDNQLVVSMDGVSVHLPPEKTGRRVEDAPKLHVDESPTDSKKHTVTTIQGYVTANEVEEGDATLTVLTNSHAMRRKYLEAFPPMSKKKWYPVDDAQREWFVQNGCEQKHILSRPGDLVLWYSTTVHSGMESNPQRKNPKIRNVVYVCMHPKKFLTEKIGAKRRFYFDTLRTTTHHPTRVNVFAKLPYTPGRPEVKVASLSPPILTVHGQSLID